MGVILHGGICQQIRSDEKGEGVEEWKRPGVSSREVDWIISSSGSYPPRRTQVPPIAIGAVPATTKDTGNGILFFCLG